MAVEHRANPKMVSGSNLFGKVRAWNLWKVTRGYRKLQVYLRAVIGQEQKANFPGPECGMDVPPPRLTGFNSEFNSLFASLVLQCCSVGFDICDNPDLVLY